MSETSPEPLVTPFVGEHFAEAERLSKLISPPYDVIDGSSRATLAGQDLHNIVHVLLPEGGERRYDDAARLLHRWRQEGVLVRDRDPGVYVLRQEFRTGDGRSHVRSGVIGAIAAEPYQTGRVKPHERTHAGPKKDRLALLGTTQTMFESLLVLARDSAGELVGRIGPVMGERPLAQGELNGDRLALWRVGGSAAREMAEAAGAESLYIADGHHRFETAWAYREQNPAAGRTLGLIVPLGDPGLVLLATHRLLHGAALTEGDLREVCGGRFDIERVEPELSPEGELAGLARGGSGALVTLPGGLLFRLAMQPGAEAARGNVDPVVWALDVARIDSLVVRPLAERAGPESKVTYSADFGQVLELLIAGQAVAGVALNPTKVEQVLAVADAGAVMPPKSTYFAPKVPSGLVMLPYASRASD